jgi:hypothetical protein
MSVKGEKAPILGALHKDLKMSTPDTFSGDRSKLKAFLIQVELFIGFNSTRFNSDTERVLWTTALLRGAAFNWIEAFITDYMDNRTDKGECTTAMGEETIAIFQTFKGFKKRITRVFGDIDQERTAERHIQNLRQKGSAASYTAEFQQYSGKTDWNDDALKAQYYKGLKDMVKDEIARSDRPNDLQKMIEMAIKIDNRNFERNMERKGQYAPGDYKKKPGRKNYWPQPMELDATFKPGRPRDKNKERQLKERLCFNCSKPGHLARECKQPKRKGERRPGKQLNATWTGRFGYSTPKEINASLGTEPIEWEVTNQEIEKFRLSAGDDAGSDSDDTWEMESLTTSEQEEYDELVKESPILEKDKDWVVKRVKAHQEEMREMKRIHDENVKELDTYYQGKKDALNEIQERLGFKGKGKETDVMEEVCTKLDLKNTFYQVQMVSPDPKETREKQQRATTRFEELSKEQESTIPGYENGNIAEADHPWHRWLLWDHCYTNSCQTHLESKKRHFHFPHARLPVYAQQHDVARRAERRRSIEGHAAFIKEQQAKN